MFIEEILHNTAVDRTAKEQNLAALIIVLKTILLFIFCNVRIQSQVRLQKQCMQQASFNRGVGCISCTFMVLHYKPLKWGKHKPTWNKFSSRLNFYIKHLKNKKLTAWELMRRRLRGVEKAHFCIQRGEHMNSTNFSFALSIPYIL